MCVCVRACVCTCVFSLGGLVRKVEICTCTHTHTHAHTHTHTHTHTHAHRHTHTHTEYSQWVSSDSAGEGEGVSLPHDSLWWGDFNSRGNCSGKTEHTHTHTHTHTTAALAARVSGQRCLHCVSQIRITHA